MSRIPRDLQKSPEGDGEIEGETEGWHENDKRQEKMDTFAQLRIDG